MNLISKSATDRIYSNAGNKPLIKLLDENCLDILDVGCGAGDNAALIEAQNPACKIWGITRSKAEANLAERAMEKCWIANLEHDLPEEVTCRDFDAILFSHILEHLQNPAEILARFLTVLRPGGVVLIAVPNVLVWRQRIKFMLGNFEYEEAGVLDDTHLRFFTFDSAEKYLLSQTPDLEILNKSTTGSVPLWLLRRYIFPYKISTWIDETGCRYWPNLFGSQVFIKAKLSD